MLTCHGHANTATIISYCDHQLLVFITSIYMPLFLLGFDSLGHKITVKTVSSMHMATSHMATSIQQTADCCLQVALLFNMCSANSQSSYCGKRAPAQPSSSGTTVSSSGTTVVLSGTAIITRQACAVLCRLVSACVPEPYPGLGWQLQSGAAGRPEALLAR